MGNNLEVKKYERFHYTSINGLLGILENNTLRMCSYRTMNDPGELKWFVGTILESINRDKGSTETEFLNTVRSVLENEPTNAYMACFSSDKDLLSQWRAYADDGQGVAIGFNLSQSTFTNNRPYTEPTTNTDQSTGYFDVEYEVETPQDICKDFVELFKDFSKHVEEAPYTLIPWARLFAFNLMQRSVSLKHSAYKEEKECRLLSLAPMGLDKESFGSISNVKFKASSDKLTSYLDYKFPKNIITEIVLGPRSNIDQSELTLFLHKYGYENIIITQSSTPYS
ncbi:hypothetical protein BCT90_01495 [Vibrio lentus]|uniref:DUF2971 domain-containing protein n=1 Tax=Vibrio lentus TaxID=136468 RepID=UPI000C83A8AD|nr:DUF2971 domain-containing protein [Vibrio lentus]PMK84188.1 hypothetical protein BCT90_01495 [Vibrio lentus]